MEAVSVDVAVSHRQRAIERHRGVAPNRARGSSMASKNLPFSWTLHTSHGRSPRSTTGAYRKIREQRAYCGETRPQFAGTAQIADTASAPHRWWDNCRARPQTALHRRRGRLLRGSGPRSRVGKILKPCSAARPRLRSFGGTCSVYIETIIV